MKHPVLLLCFLLSYSWIFSQQTEKKTALLIGISDYKYSSDIPFSLNNIDSLEYILKKQGFEVMTSINPKRTEMLRTIKEFGKKLSRNETGFFYYCGHARQYDNTNNFILSYDDFRNEYDIELECIDFMRIYKTMVNSESKQNILVFDACRKSILDMHLYNDQKKGIIHKDIFQPAIFIAYSSEPGTIVDIKTDSMNVYSKELIKLLKTQEIRTENLFKKLHNNVEEITKGEQKTWFKNYEVDYIFNERK